MLTCIHILIGINAATGKADLPVTEQHCCRRLAKGFKARCTYSLGHASLTASASMHRLPGTVALWKVEEGQQSCVGSKSSQVCRQQRSHQLQCSASMHPLSCTIAVHEVEDAAGLCTAANPHRCMRSHQKWRPQLRPNWQLQPACTGCWAVLLCKRLRMQHCKRSRMQQSCVGQILLQSNRTKQLVHAGCCTAAL